MDTLLSELETYRIEVQQQCTIMEELRHSEKLKTEKLEQSVSAQILKQVVFHDNNNNGHMMYNRNYLLRSNFCLI